jgi:hypothetical protein
MGIVILWLVLMGLWVKKVHVTGGGWDVEETQSRGWTVNSPRREWMEIYLKEEKVGYSVRQVTPIGENYLVREEIFLKLNLMGQPNDVYALTQSVVDDRFTLKRVRFRMTSGAVSFQVSGKVEGNRMLLEIGQGRSRRRERIRLKKPPVIGSGIAHFFRGRRLQVGDSFRFSVFDPSTMVQKPMVLTVAAEDEVVIGRIRHEAYRLTGEMWGRSMTFWVDGSGTVLKEKGFMGLTLVKSSAADAPRGVAGSGRADFYQMTAVTVKGRLPDPRQMTRLRLKLLGLKALPFDTRILDSGRQRYRDGIVEIARENLPDPAPSGQGKPHWPDHLKPFLEPEFNIESRSPAIRQKAARIAGDLERPRVAAQRVMGWLYRNIRKRPVVSVPSALEVLKTRVGDCNEHAVLLAAFLRALGIPAKVCAGLVFARGKFLYHAWNEAFLGGWISMDATLDQMPADVTHIKMVEGGLDKQTELIAVIGKLKAEVLDYRYD